MGFFSKNIVFLLGSFLLIAIGVAIGFNCREAQDGTYIRLYNPLQKENDKLLLVIGETTIVQMPHDLNQLDADSTILLSERISKLNRDTRLAGLLRDMRDRRDSNGPFATKDYNVTIRFSDENGLNGQLASTCKNNRDLRGRLISLQPSDTGRSQTCRTVLEEISAHCNTKKNIIWISKTTGMKLLQLSTPDELPEEIIATATVLAKTNA